MSEIKVATWNLYQFAKPGTYWYDEEEDNDYEPDQWASKLSWITKMVQDLDADIIGFQEIFSVSEFKQHFKSLGYEHVAVADTPAVSPENENIFVGPVTGIASRFPFVGEPTALEFPEELRQSTQIQSDFDFRRKITRAVIDVPDIGEIVVYVCHFKSKGTFVDGDEIAEFDGWKARFREHLRSRAINDADQIVRRSAEAAGVYLAAMKELDEDNSKPLIVVGDMNDNPQSPTLRMLTQQEWIDNIARKKRSNIESASDRAWNFTWQIYDAYGLLPSQNSASRPVTHAGGWNYPAETLDYVFVTNVLNPKNPKHIAAVTDIRVHSEHFENLNKLLTTDHAPVCITLTLRD